FCFSRSCSRYSVSLVRPRPCWPGGNDRDSNGHFGLSHLLPFRKSFIFSRRQRRQSAPVYRAIVSLPRSQTRRRLGGRQPLCGCGVTSEIVPTSRPAACSERIAVSRPDPGPLTNTSTLRMPCSMARRAAASAASWAAKGVDLRDPLNPTCPEDAHAMTAPAGSVIDTMVLLKVLLMWACPWATFLRSLRRTFFVPVPLRAFGGMCLCAPSYRLLACLLLPGDGALGSLAGARVRAGPLSPHRQAPAVPDALVAADLNLAPDVRGDLPAQVTLQPVVGLQVVTEPDELLVGQVAHPLVRVDPGGRERLAGAGPADPEDVRERDLRPLVAGEVNPD